jgi:hypothetical protein
MKNTRLYYASAVIADGRVFVSGGEDSDAGDRTNASEIFNPFKNSWTSIAPPSGWNNIGDAFYDNRTAIYDPITNTWTQSAKKEDTSSTEETWTLLPDNTILTVECKNHPRAEKYVISKDEWVSAGSTPVEIVQDSTEIRPAILLPNGNVFAIGATGRTAIYTPPPSDPSQQGYGLQDQISLQTQMEI